MADISETDRQVLHLALDNAKGKGDVAIMVRTQTVVDLGGESALPNADLARFNNMPEAGRPELTSQVTCDALRQLLVGSSPKK